MASRQSDKVVLAEIPPLPPGWKRVADHKERWEKLRLEAQALARELARNLVQRYGARRVWLYGSAVGTWVFHDGSDIDLAVEGLDGLPLTEAHAALQKRTDFRLDLWPRDWLSAKMWNEMIPRPVLLAERNDGAAPGPGSST